MSESKLITLDLLQKFSDKCKQTFDTAHVKASGSGTQFIIRFNTNLDNYTSYLKLSGFGDNYLESFIYYDAKGIVVNDGVIKITEAYLYTSETHSLLYITLDEAINNLSLSYFITNETQLVNCVTDFQASPFTKPTDCKELTIVVKPDQEEISFKIKDANGNFISYPSVKEFNSIEQAGKVTNVTFYLGDSSEDTTVDVEKDSHIPIPTINYRPGTNITINDNHEISASFPDASAQNKGVVQIGEGIKCQNGVISVKIDQASESALGTVKVNGSVEEDQMPVKINDNGFAYVEKEDAHRFRVMPQASAERSGTIVEYIGKTSGDYNQGYFYICEPDYQIQIPFLAENDLNLNTGALFAKYMQDKTWESGEAIDVADFQGVWSYSYIGGVLKLFNATHSCIIPKDDFAKFNMKITAESDSSGNARFYGDDFAWIQQNVQPLAYLDTEALEFMTDEDTDSIFATPVTEIIVRNSKTEEIIPEQFETSEAEIELIISPSDVIYSYSGDVQLSYNENALLTLIVNGNGIIHFVSVIYPEVTKTINITKHEETV